MKKVFCISAILLLFGSVLAGCPSTTPPTPAITSFTINNGGASTSSLTVTLNNACTGIPTQYMASESSSFTEASWETYTSAPSFTLSSGIGTKTVYFKVKNESGESEVVNDTITLNELPVSGTEETVMLPGNVPLTMVWCPEGTFMMGATANEQDSGNSEKPQHQVTLTQGFWMGKYELTKAQWTAVMGTTPWAGQAEVLNDPNSPAVYISWDGAQLFITALNSYTGLTFRLPSEAQWEYAARAGTITRFYWGDDSDYTLIDNYAWYSDNCSTERYAHVVGQKLPNAWGLYDMSGNVYEWCQDWWAYSYTAGAVTNPTGPDTGSLRVYRGGSWYLYDYYCRSAYRIYGYPSPAYQYLGLRLAR